MLLGLAFACVTAFLGCGGVHAGIHVQLYDIPIARLTRINSSREGRHYPPFRSSPVFERLDLRCPRGDLL